MKIRVGIAVAAMTLAVDFAFLPFRDTYARYAGPPPGSASFPCRAPVFAGWSGGSPYRADGTEYDGSQQCGYDTRLRLIGAGAVLFFGLLGLAVTLGRGLTDKDAFEPNSW
jgi:hypothetical protein